MMTVDLFASWVQYLHLIRVVVGRISSVFVEQPYCHRVLLFYLNFHEGSDDIHLRASRQFEFFPILIAGTSSVDL